MRTPARVVKLSKKIVPFVAVRLRLSFRKQIMLAFDLETTSLNPLTGRVTCAAVCDPSKGLERVFFFHSADSDANANEFMGLLDEAPRLCGFNAARFDLPFIRHQLGATEARVASWRMKLHDVFEGCKLALGITFGLEALLECNGLPGKTGSGADAIILANEKRWEELGLYCLNDTKCTHAVSNLDLITLPKTRGIFMRSDGTFVAGMPETS